MKRRNRDINIFSISALDLFASALGAFILVAVLLLPYFPNTGDSAERVAQLRTQLRELRQENAELTARLSELREQYGSGIQPEHCGTCEELYELRERVARGQAQIARQEEELARLVEQVEGHQEQIAQLQDELKKKYILVIMSWNTQDDVDLHVVDPRGNEYYYKKRAFAGSPARFEEDNRIGPGNEIWLHPEATAGNYTIYYKFYQRRSASNPVVRGLVLYPSGRHPLRNRGLSRVGEKIVVAIIHVDNNGIPSVRE